MSGTSIMAEKKMTNEEIKSMMNSTFSGLAFFFRDFDLDGSLIFKNQTKQTISTSKRMGKIGYRDELPLCGGIFV